MLYYEEKLIAIEQFELSDIVQSKPMSDSVRQWHLNVYDETNGVEN